MEPHIIRLRGGWECTLPGSSPEATTRLTLPVPARSLPPGRLRLIRRFNRPVRVVDASVVLRCDDCPGILEVRFNGERLDAVPTDRADFEMPLGTLAARNEIAIEAIPPREERNWGAIALIFHAGPRDGVTSP